MQVPSTPFGALSSKPDRATGRTEQHNKRMGLKLRRKRKTVTMYRKEIEGFIDSHREEMIEDICTLCRINSEKMPYVEASLTRKARSRPSGSSWHGRGLWFLSAIMTIMWEQPTSMTRERQLDIPGPPGRGSLPVRMDGDKSPFEPVVKDRKLFGHLVPQMTRTNRGCALCNEGSEGAGNPVK